MMEQPRILTVILNYRTPDLTLKSAAAAVREMRALGGEVVIVDNASGDGSVVQLREGITAWQDVCRLIESPVNGGFGAGNNVGIRAGMSDGTVPDFYYLLNSDAWPDEGALDILLDALKTQPDAGLVGSHIRGEDGVDHTTCFRFPTILGEFEGAIRFGPVTRLLSKSVIPMETPETLARVDWSAGASLLMRREMLEEVGLFDETFFLYYEETELCHRAAKAGWLTYFAPDSSVVHVGSVSTGMKKWERVPEYWLNSRWYYFTKIHGRGYAILATLARLTGGALFRLRRLVSHRPQGDPPRLMRDMARHTLGQLLRPLPRRKNSAALPIRPVSEDSK